MNLQIYNLDATTEESAVCELGTGQHILGRGGLLKCQDKRVSRNHALISVSDEKATITSTHQNPCFYQSATSKTITILKKDVPNDVSDGDKFGLFPDQFWFRIKMIKLENGDAVVENGTTEVNALNNGQNHDSNDSFVFPIDNEPSTSACNINENDVTVEANTSGENIKKLTEELSDAGELTPNLQELEIIADAAKRDELSDGGNVTPDLDELEQNNAATKEELSDAGDVTPDLDELEQNVNMGKKDELSDADEEDKTESKKDKTELSATTLKTEILSDDNAKDNPVDGAGAASASTSANTTNTDAAKDANDSNQPSSSTNKRKFRDRCVYADKCYRKNPLHKAEYSHPGDGDYDSDSSDDRPVCPFGASCYRKNKDHRAQYRHPRSSGPAPKQRKLRAKKAKANTAENDSSEDDYDYDDPFLDDDSDDDYQEESWSDDTDTDWKDSQVVDDDDVTKTLVKEAKRFTRGRKKKD